MGMLSYQAIVALHAGQYERLVKKGLSYVIRYATTFKKDPQHAKRIKSQMNVMITT